ncbi:eukaryotic translation elongation factor 1 epsilon-1-like [Antedon mediterranea]|uniref:eukaryotic translation elongation factor 1 epsilon-1-like n=1 Tax=Antedon mediterranea TaxID=105859 RepID=UPI003AF470C0
MADIKQEIRAIAKYFNFGNVKVNINSETKAPILHEDGKILTGMSTILQYLAQRDISGQTAENTAGIRQWLEYRATDIDRCDNEKDSYLVLKELNLYLSTKTYFVGNCLTIADLCIYHGLHSVLSHLTYQEKEKYNHVSRWFQFIQCQPQYTSNLPSIPFQSQALYSVA